MTVHLLRLFALVCASALLLQRILHVVISRDPSPSMMTATLLALAPVVYFWVRELRGSDHGKGEPVGQKRTAIAPRLPDCDKPPQLSVWWHGARPRLPPRARR